MEFIITDAERMEVGYLPSGAQVDIDLTRDTSNRAGCNDIELTVAADTEGLNYGSYIFSPGTEYGGRILDQKRSTASTSTIWYLDTWRRMLGQAVIEPPEGEAYRVIEGEANAVLTELMAGRFEGIFIVPEESSGIKLSGQFDRYTTLLDGINKLLAAHNARLKIQVVQGGTGEAFHVVVRAVPVKDYSSEIEYSSDNKVNLTIRDYRRGINHLICLGAGELTERMVRHLYIQEDGNVGSEQFYTGLEERTEVFDYPNAENESELLESGKEKLLELASYKKLEMSVQDLDLDIGDIVAGRDRLTGMYLAKPITNKVLKIKNGKETISYKVKGEN